MNYLIILSGGTGSRMHSNIPKQYIEVLDKPILFYTLKCFDLSLFNKVSVVVSNSWKKFVKELVNDNFQNDKFVYAEAGLSRQESILNGLESLYSFASKEDVVIIHDAARPCCHQRIVDNLIFACKNHEGAMPVLPVKDTIYLSKNGKCISNLLNRDELFCGQSPEAFRYEAYYSIHKGLSSDDLKEIRGSSEIAFKNGLDIVFVHGDESNFKITTPIDLKRFKETIESEGEQ